MMLTKISKLADQIKQLGQTQGLTFRESRDIWYSQNTIYYQTPVDLIHEYAHWLCYPDTRTYKNYGLGKPVSIFRQTDNYESKPLFDPPEIIERESVSSLAHLMLEDYMTGKVHSANYYPDIVFTVNNKQKIVPQTQEHIRHMTTALPYVAVTVRKLRNGYA